MENDNNNLVAKLEAILFAYGETIEVRKLAKLMKVEEKKVVDGIGELKSELERDERGLALVVGTGNVQLVTKPQFQEFVTEMVKGEFQESLTPAALETLSIIAYAGPVIRSEIDYIRGVNSSFILRSLLVRGLIERMVHPKRANVYMYNPSFDFLKHLGITSQKELPEFSRFKEVVEKLRGAEV